MATLILSHYLIKSLKDQYLTIGNPLDLWTELKKKSRYDHQRTVLLPNPLFDWRNPRMDESIASWAKIMDY